MTEQKTYGKIMTMMLTLKNTTDILAYWLTGLLAYRLVIPAYTRNIVVNNDVCGD